MKKISAAAMSCILAASMSVSALAAEENGAEKAVVSTEKTTEETQVKTDDSIKVLSLIHILIIGNSLFTVYK